MAGFDGDEHIEVARGIRAAVESEGGHSRPYNEFYKRLAAAGIHVSSTIASKLWRAVDESSETSGDDEDAEAQDTPPEPQLAQDPPEELDLGVSLVEIEASHFYPIEDEELLESLEARMSQGLASVSRTDYDAAEKRMLILLQQAHFFCEVRKMGLSASQVRTLLKGMAPKVKESVQAFAYRYSSAHAVYIRLVGPSGFEESLKTKGRKLLTAAGLPVPDEFLGPEVSLSSGHSPKAEQFQSPIAGPFHWNAVGSGSAISLWWLRYSEAGGAMGAGERQWIACTLRGRGDASGTQGGPEAGQRVAEKGARDPFRGNAEEGSRESG